MKTTAEECREVRAVLARLGLEGEPSRIVRLPGLTNRVFRVSLAGETLALRIPGPGTERIIDRAREEAHARIAAAAGLTPEILRFEPDGVMVTRYLARATPLSAEAFRSRPGAVERAAAALRDLHGLSTCFPGRFDIPGTIERYRRIVAASPMTEPAFLAEALAGWAQIRAALGAHPTPHRSCHCDPTGANLLDDGGRVRLVDWEYSGMNDPAWDLAYLSVQSGFDAALDHRLAAAYFGRATTPAEAARVAVLKAAVELMSALWALVQVTLGNPVADFDAYAATTLRSVVARRAGPGFDAALAAISGGWDIGARPC